MAPLSAVNLNAELTRNGIPLEFGGCSFVKWRTDDLKSAIRALGSHVKKGTNKIGLCQQLHKLKPHRSSFSSIEWDAIREIRDRETYPRAAASVKRSRSDSDVKLQDIETSTRRKRHTISAFKHTIEICQVCLDGFTLDAKTEPSITSSCTHTSGNAICFSCIQESITVQCTNKAWNEIGCPIPGCSATLKYGDIQRLAPKEVFNRYDNFLLRKAIDSDSTYCECAHSDCKSGGICDPRTDSYVTCADCGRLTCIECQTPFHPGKPCTENQEEVRKKQEEEDARAAEERKIEDEASTTYVGTYAKTCPNEECGMKIDKAGGCDHMTCLKCRHEFCWACMRPYGPIRSQGNHMHAETCEHHTNRLPTMPPGVDLAADPENSEVDSENSEVDSENSEVDSENSEVDSEHSDVDEDPCDLGFPPLRRGRPPRPLLQSRLATSNPVLLEEAEP